MAVERMWREHHGGRGSLCVLERCPGPGEWTIIDMEVDWKTVFPDSS